MQNLLSLLLVKMIRLGFFDIVVFLLSLSIIYAILKKSKILGQSPVINGIISFSISILILVFPVITGISIVMPFSKFFTQAMIFVVIFFFAIMLASLFYPNMIEWLAKTFTSRNTLWSMIGLGITLFITSGLVTLLYKSVSSSTGTQNWGIYPSGAEASSLGSSDVYILAAGLIIFIVILLIASSIGKGK